MIALHVPHTAWIMTAEGWREIAIDRPEARQFVDARGVVNDWPVRMGVDVAVFLEGCRPSRAFPGHGKSVEMKLLVEGELF